jgi:hypothetical protein
MACIHATRGTTVDSFLAAWILSSICAYCPAALAGSSHGYSSRSTRHILHVLYTAEYTTRTMWHGCYAWLRIQLYVQVYSTQSNTHEVLRLLNESTSHKIEVVLAGHGVTMNRTACSSTATASACGHAVIQVRQLRRCKCGIDSNFGRSRWAKHSAQRCLTLCTLPSNQVGACPE